MPKEPNKVNSGYDKIIAYHLGLAEFHIHAAIIRAEHNNSDVDILRLQEAMDKVKNERNLIRQSVMLEE